MIKPLLALQEEAARLAPWRYDHTCGSLKIAGDPVAAPIHGSLGRGADTMAHILNGLRVWQDLSKLRALDLGCLEGHYTDLLCAAGFSEVVAVDTSEQHLARARFLLQELRGYTNVRLARGNVEEPEFMAGLGTFDVILFHGLLYHLKDPIGIFGVIAKLAAPNHVLLLSTQFKFAFAEIVVRSPIANIKVRRLGTNARQKEHYVRIGSVYSSTATRLNPIALYYLLQEVGYTDVTTYDTPLGARYGFQANLIATTFDQNNVREALNKNHDIPKLSFSPWAGDRIDGFSLVQGWRSVLSQLVLRAAYLICEKLGRSGARQSARANIVEMS